MSLIDPVGIPSAGTASASPSSPAMSPPLFESFELLGRDETLARLKKLVAYLADHSA